MPENRPTALVTGSATGIGRATALGLAKAGFDIAVNYSVSSKQAEQTQAMCRQAGAETVLIKADVSMESEVEHMIAEVKERFGGLDVLANNAGTTIAIPPAEFETITLEDWDRVFAVNVTGVFLCCKHGAALLRRSENASIVNTASIVGLRPGPQPLPYSASKAAVISMTQTLAGALGPEIRVNAVAPGWMEGDWMKRALGADYERLMERRARFTPLKRCVTADDVAEVIVGLVTGNSFLTGQVIVVDGGYSAVT